MKKSRLSEFKRYKRVKNLRSSGPSLRVNRGYIYLNRALVEGLESDHIDLYVSPSGKSLLMKAGEDYKITRTPHGRGSFSAGPLIHDLGMVDGLYLGEVCEEGFLFVLTPHEKKGTIVVESSPEF